jgi:hypothetical protein
MVNHATTHSSSKASQDDNCLSVCVEGIDRILIPTTNLKRDLAYFSQHFGLSSRQRGRATNDPFLEAYAILETPNGLVLELVKPKQQYENIFAAPIYCYTVRNLIEKRDSLVRDGCELLGDVVDTQQGWAWFYVRSQAGILSQIQGPLTMTES